MTTHQKSKSKYILYVKYQFYSINSIFIVEYWIFHTAETSFIENQNTNQRIVSRLIEFLLLFAGFFWDRKCDTSVLLNLGKENFIIEPFPFIYFPQL